MADAVKRYPLSTADGSYIPLDAIRPVSAVKTAFTTSGASSAITIPDTVEMLVILSDENCWAKFAASASVAAIPADNTIVSDLLFIPAGFQMVVAFPIDKPSLSFIGDTASGTVVTQLLETWTGLSLQSQLTRQ